MEISQNFREEPPMNSKWWVEDETEGTDETNWAPETDGSFAAGGAWRGSDCVEAGAERVAVSSGTA